ncbi:MAG: diiron oxygenase [Deltaproteobacteria bacterium]|jgi:hypothetical protein
MVAARPYPEVVERLSAQSVKKHFDAYADVDWDAHTIHPEDPRFALDESDPLGATDWYRQLPPATQARIGLHNTVHQMKVGVFFENVLSRGLLEFAARRPDGDPAFRYAYHEVIEESQHSLMFQEFVNRTGLHAPGLPWIQRVLANQVPLMGRRFPEMFFFFVLGGEAPIDQSQRDALERRNLHPLLRRIMRIHVLEEARHICFAKRYIEEHVPRLGVMNRLHLMGRVPFVLAIMARQMLEAPSVVVDAYGVPASVVRAAYRDNPEHRANLRRSVTPIVELSARVGILNPTTLPLWRRLGLVEPRQIAMVGR